MRKRPVFKNPRYAFKPQHRNHKRYDGHHLTNWILRQVQRQFNLDDIDLAEMLDLNPCTIRCYFMNPEKPSYRIVPLRNILFLRAELASRYPTTDFSKIDSTITIAKTE